LRIADSVVEDPVEERLPLLARPLAVAAGQPQHGILHHVEGVVRVAQGHLRDAVGAPFHAGEESVERA
jgi:hypothetical protein